MNKISFEGIGEMVATFACAGEVTAGQVVKMTGNGTVGPCDAGDDFCGVALSAQEGYAAVQVAGLVTVVTADELTVGWAVLAADGDGGVAAADAGTAGTEDTSTASTTAAAAGRQMLVVWADSGSAVICL